MVQDYVPDPNFPWNQNAEQQYQYQNRIQNYNYYRPEYENSSSSSVVTNMPNPSHATDSTFNYTLEQLRLPEYLARLNPLGLKLNNSPELARWMERQLNAPRIETTWLRDPGSQPASEKQKPATKPVNVLKIGSWERVARNESDVVAKCYFKKEKLVWEILEGSLKSKIEVQWSDIIAIDACIRENEPGVLRLKQRPSFFLEKDPQPRKHTIWTPTSDFTGGEASKCRRHEIVFPPGKLEKPYEKLLLADQRLFQLSRNPFPSLQDPYFPPLHDFCPDFNPTLNMVINPVLYPNPQQHFSQLSSPSPVSDQQMTTSAAMWDEMLPEPNPNVGLVSYDMSVAGNQYLAPERSYYDSSSGASLSDGHINSNNLFDTEMSSNQFSGSVSEGSPSSVDKNFLMMQRLEILGNLETGHYADLALRRNEMFDNQQQQQYQQQGFVPDPAAAGLITSGEMYAQQQQVLVPDRASTGMIMNGGQMYEQQQQPSGFYGYPYPVGGISGAGMVHFDLGNNIERVLRMDLDQAQQF
ncbi:unnamed protein product [Linum trigynum]|uniref:TRF2/HOY1 PH-like domain-containing protein n=1 Tax=Linum trigynum TaxID=586398 RepID=A0AAV2F5M5_9ROSI